MGQSFLTMILLLAGVALVPTEARARVGRPASSPQTSPTRAADPVQQCIQKGNAITTACSTRTDNERASEQSSTSSETGREINQSNNNNVSDMCNQSGQNAQAAGATLDRIGQECRSTYDECKSACQQAQSRLSGLTQARRKQFDEAKAKCDTAESLLQGIGSERGNASQAQQRAQQCKNDTGMGQMPQMPQMPQSPQDQAKNCQENPNSPECFKLKEDCSNPEFAMSNEVCKCLSGQCGNKRQAGTDPDQGADTSTGGLSSGDPSGLDGSGGGAKPFESAYGNPNIQGGGGAMGGGRGGGSSDAGSGEGFHADEPTTSALAGAGAGGSGLVVPQSAGTISGGSYSNSGSWIPPKMNESNLDVEKFRPNGAVRNPAGDVPGQIHGAHVNMWRQINLRYLSVRSTLKP